MSNIHPTSIIHDGCEIDQNVSIGPYSIIGPNVKIGKNSKIHSHVVIDGNTTIGLSNEIYSFSVLGSNPQHFKYQGEKTQLIIGNNNIFREHVTIHPGYVKRTSGLGTRKLENYGHKWAHFQASYFGVNSQPFYLIMDPNTYQILNDPVGYMPDVNEYISFLECGLSEFKSINEE